MSSTFGSKFLSAPGPLSVRPEASDLLSCLDTALWIYDFEAHRIVWANRKALTLWDADAPESLATRDMAQEMSSSVHQRLEQHLEDFLEDPDREIHETWTLYPNNKPFRVRAILKRCILPSRRIGMLVEARPDLERESETIRSADALLHAETIVALFDDSGRELYANPVFRGTFGPGRHDLEELFSSPADVLEFNDRIAEGEDHRATVRVYTRSGQRWFDIHAISCRDAFTGGNAVLINATDVTEAKAQSAALEHARDEAEKSAADRSDFLAELCSRLQAPIGKILEQARSDEPADVTDAAQDMRRLINNVLELVKAEAPALQDQREPFDPQLLVEAACARVRGRAETKGLKIVSTCDPLSEHKFVHDPTAILTVLRHLLENAIAFTERGFIRVRTAIESSTSLRIEVSDSGIGIDSSRLDKVFEKFSTPKDGIGQGAGLGLSICQDIVRGWGGEIGVESSAGRGSLFWITIPNAVRVAPAADAQDSVGRPRHLRIISDA